MATQHKIKFSVDMDTGDVIVETEGYAGKECYEDTEKLEKMLGEAVETKPKGEAYKGKEYEVQRRV